MSESYKALLKSLREVRAQLSYWPRTVRLIWTAAPASTAAWAILLVIQGVLPAVSVYLTKLIVESVVGAIGAGGSWERLRPALVLIAISALVMLISETLQSVISWVRANQSELVQDHIKSLVQQQAIAVDLGFYESAEYHDRLNRAVTEAAARPLTLLESFGGLMQNTITLVAMAAVLLQYSVWLPLVLLASTLPALYVVLHFDRQYHQWWKRTTVDRRWAQYYDYILTDSHSAAEMRLFSLSAHFQAAYQKLRLRLRNERLIQLRSQSLARLAAGLLGLLVSGGAMVWMLWRALHGRGTLGDLAMFYQAVDRGQSLMRSLLGSLGQIYSSTLFLGNLFAFLEMKPMLKDPRQPVAAPGHLTKGIRLRNVTFRYPGSKRAALDNFSLFIPAGKVVAIVGPNGAGKTTLLKLLCRFYDPESGSIELDDIDLRALAVDDLRRMLTVLFQFSLRYHATAGENIACGNLGESPTQPDIETAARSAGAHDIIASLPLGYDTLLGKLFTDGTELSAGEWQRVAMARAYLRRSPIILLDEPTSFMDSWAENDWFDRFRALAAQRTAIVITHRFTIARRADFIYVMDNGEIVESGTYDQLVAADGLYAASWAAQMDGASPLRLDRLTDRDSHLKVTVNEMEL